MGGSQWIPKSVFLTQTRLPSPPKRCSHCSPRHGLKIEPLWVHPAEALFRIATPPERKRDFQIEPLWVHPAEADFQMLTP